MCSTKEEQVQFGARYNEVFRLEYFDPILMHVIDPMHNLMLGVAKHIFIFRVDFGFISVHQLQEIDKRMKRIKVSSDAGLQIAFQMRITNESRRMEALDLGVFHVLFTRCN